MKLLVCFKLIADLDRLPADYFIADEQLQVNTGFVPSILNCYDESALEMARELAELNGEDVELTALTLGSDAAEATLKTLYALGYAHGLRIDSHDDIRFSPERVAAAVAAYTAGNPQDVIFTGVQSPEGDNGQMPLILAERLGWPCITQVTGIQCLEDGTLEVVSVVDDGILTQRIRPPAVLAVGDAPNTYLKVPTLKDRMQKGRRPVEVIQLEELAPEGEPAIRLVGLNPLNHARQGRVIEGETAHEKVMKLYESYIKDIIEQL